MQSASNNNRKINIFKQLLRVLIQDLGFKHLDLGLLWAKLLVCLILEFENIFKEFDNKAGKWDSG